MKPLTLSEFVERAEDEEGAAVTLRPTVLPPRAIDNLRRLQRLGLLDDETVFALIGQAPIDPIGVYGALRNFGVWAFQPLDFTVVQVLAKQGAKPVALMRIDLLSDDITFVALKEGMLVEHAVVSADTFVEKLKQPGITEEKVMAWLQTYISAAIAAGKGQ